MKPLLRYALVVLCFDVVACASGSVYDPRASDPTDDAVPDTFAFTDAVDVGLWSVVVSDSVTITGINVPTAVTVVGGSLEIDADGVWLTAPTTVSEGSRIRVRHIASASYATATTTTLTVGTVGASFVSTTLPQPTQAETYISLVLVDSASPLPDGTSNDLDATHGQLYSVLAALQALDDPAATASWAIDDHPEFVAGGWPAKIDGARAWLDAGMEICSFGYSGSLPYVDHPVYVEYAGSESSAQLQISNGGTLWAFTTSEGGDNVTVDVSKGQTRSVFDSTLGATREIEVDKLGVFNNSLDFREFLNRFLSFSEGGNGRWRLRPTGNNNLDDSYCYEMRDGTYAANIGDPLAYESSRRLHEEIDVAIATFESNPLFAPGTIQTHYLFGGTFVQEWADHAKRYPLHAFVGGDDPNPIDPFNVDWFHVPKTMENSVPESWVNDADWPQLTEPEQEARIKGFVAQHFAAVRGGWSVIDLPHRNKPFTARETRWMIEEFDRLGATMRSIKDMRLIGQAARPRPQPKGVFPRLAHFYIGGPRNYESQIDLLARFDMITYGFLSSSAPGRTKQVLDDVRASRVAQGIVGEHVAFQYTNVTSVTDPAISSDPRDAAKDATVRSVVAAQGQPFDGYLYNVDGVRAEKSSSAGWIVNIAATDPASFDSAYVSRTPGSVSLHEELARHEFHYILGGAGGDEFDGVYSDVATALARTAANAAPYNTQEWDWDGDGVNETQLEAATIYRNGIRLYAEAWRRLRPDYLHVVNNTWWGNYPSLPEYDQAFDGGISEGYFGSPYSREGLRWRDSDNLNVSAAGTSWLSAITWIKREYDFMRTKFHAVQAQGPNDAYWWFRYSACSTWVMTDSFFDYGTFGAESSTPPWFDEYDNAGASTPGWFGAPLEPPRHVDGSPYYMREFEHVVVIVTPRVTNTGSADVARDVFRDARTPVVITLPAGSYRRIAGIQDTSHNNGATESGTLSLPDTDGIVLIRN